MNSNDVSGVQVLSSFIAQPPAHIRYLSEHPTPTLSLGTGGTKTANLLDSFGSGSLYLVKPTTAEKPQAVEASSTLDLLTRIKESGISIGKIAEMVGASRPTIYNWQDQGVEASIPEHIKRLDLLYRAISKIPPELRPYLAKVFLREIAETPSLYQIVTREEEHQISQWAEAVQPTLETLVMNAQKPRRPIAQQHALIMPPVINEWDNMPEVGLEHHPDSIKHGYS